MSVSEFEDQMDDCNIICPYCLDSYQPESEDYSESEREEECGLCGMKFITYQSFSVDHHADPDCALNGKEHTWEPKKLRDGATHDFCSVCGKCRPHTLTTHTP